MGTSFWEYLAHIRIEKSKSLLVETDLGIERIAESVGYNNRFSYIRTFKKLAGVTPSEFRTRSPV
jgi:two-component system, response regulator YesN